MPLIKKRVLDTQKLCINSFLKIIVTDILEKIKNLRENRKLSQKQLAEKLHLEPETYRKVEKGETELSIKRLLSIAEELGVKPNYFFEEYNQGFVFNQNTNEIENNHPIINIGKTNEKLIEMLENSLKEKQQTIENLLKQNEILIASLAK